MSTRDGSEFHVDIGKPILATTTLKRIPWWMRWFLTFVPTRSFVDKEMTLRIKCWRGTIFIWGLDENRPD